MKNKIISIKIEFEHNIIDYVIQLFALEKGETPEDLIKNLKSFFIIMNIKIKNISIVTN